MKKIGNNNDKLNENRKEQTSEGEMCERNLQQLSGIWKVSCLCVNVKSVTQRS